MIELFGSNYDLIENVKDGYQPDSLENRSSEILKKYDYIVGDWGYDQLRLKGFYEDTHTKAALDAKISALDDYLYEYCNFGCAYFVLKKDSGRKKSSSLRVPTPES
ncbi:YutD family protein [Virgibacillus halophilus]|uniref:YutD family protein n=1 Tax=Tigheibacillus halophilus TaxID=361280 RepID=A0ABU5C1L4_9BACI|nr:YutD family protein [Virgibacillus halophilus]